MEINNKTRFVYVGNIELEIPQEAVGDICQQGCNDEAVGRWIAKLDFSQYSDKQVWDSVKGLSDWDDDGRNTNLERMLWVAAWNIFEDED